VAFSNFIPVSSFADSTADFTQATGSQPAFLVPLPYDIGILVIPVDLCNSGVYTVNGQAVKLPATITGEVQLHSFRQNPRFLCRLSLVCGVVTQGFPAAPQIGAPRQHPVAF
jgi:hypothetical protein